MYLGLTKLAWASNRCSRIPTLYAGLASVASVTCVLCERPVGTREYRAHLQGWHQVSARREVERAVRAAMVGHGKPAAREAPMEALQPMEVEVTKAEPSPVTRSRKIDEAIIQEVVATLRAHPPGVRKGQFEAKFEEVVGRPLEVRRMGFFNTSAFLRALAGSTVLITPGEGGGEGIVTLR